MRAVIYARVASSRQIDKNEGIKAQVAVCNRYAHEHGYKIVEVFKDPGFPGTRLDRPALNKMRKLIARGSIDAVIAYDPTRLTRSVVDNRILEEEFANHDTHLRWVMNRAIKSPARSYLSNKRNQSKRGRGLRKFTPKQER